MGMDRKGKGTAAGIAALIVLAAAAPPAAEAQIPLRPGGNIVVWPGGPNETVIFENQTLSDVCDLRIGVVLPRERPPLSVVTSASPAAVSPETSSGIVLGITPSVFSATAAIHSVTLTLDNWHDSGDISGVTVNIPSPLDTGIFIDTVPSATPVSASAAETIEVDITGMDVDWDVDDNEDRDTRDPGENGNTDGSPEDNIGERGSGFAREPVSWHRIQAHSANNGYKSDCIKPSGDGKYFNLRLAGIGGASLRGRRVIIIPSNVRHADIIR